MVRRDDGVALHVPGHDRTSPLPHDIAHYIVERELGLQRGFWGRIARGAVYPGMKVVSGRQPPRAGERSRQVIREAVQQGVEAEVWVGVLVKVMRERLEANWPVVNKLLRREWRPSKPERALPVAEEVRRVCAALRAAEARWQSLAVGETLTVTWPSERRGRR
jgi:hypothetical protein